MPKEQSIITSLVELTRLRDQDAIRSKLLSSLLDITEASWLVQCRIEQQTAPLEVEITRSLARVSETEPVRSFPMQLFDQPERFLDCAHSGRPAWVRDLGTYEGMIFPLPDSGRYREFLVLFDTEVTCRYERIVGSILDLYDNFLSLVIENTQDPLTGLLNRGAFDIDLPAALIRLNERASAERQQAVGDKPSFLMMMDLDRFKRINDTFGHLYGDEVILIFSSLLRRVLGDFARLYRYGGEEFSAIVEGIALEEMRELAEKLRKTVERHDFPQVGQVTVSMGIAELKPECLPSSLLDFADQALYRAKDEGRNRVVFHENAPSQGETTPASAALQEEDDIFF